MAGFTVGYMVRSTAITAVLFLYANIDFVGLVYGVIFYIQRHDFVKEVVRMLHSHIQRVRDILFYQAPIIISVDKIR